MTKLAYPSACLLLASEYSLVRSYQHLDVQGDVEVADVAYALVRALRRIRASADGHPTAA